MADPLAPDRLPYRRLTWVTTIFLHFMPAEQFNISKQPQIDSLLPLFHIPSRMDYFKLFPGALTRESFHKKSPSSHCKQVCSGAARFLWMLVRYSTRFVPSEWILQFSSFNFLCGGLLHYYTFDSVLSMFRW